MSPGGSVLGFPSDAKAVDARMDDARPDKGAKIAEEMDLLQRSTKKSKKMPLSLILDL